MGGVYGITSISGSPGATTLAVAWAHLSDRPTLVVEADPTGGSPILAGPFRSTQPHTKSVLQLAIRPAGMTLVDHLLAETVPFPDAGSDDRRLLPGVATASQILSLEHLWDNLGHAFRHLASQGGYDVVIDMGRTRVPSPLTRLLPHLDSLAVLTGTDLPSLHRSRAGLTELRDALNEVHGTSSTAITRTAVIATKAAREGYPLPSVRQVLAPSPVAADMPWLPEAASLYTYGSAPARKTRQARFDKAAGAAVAAIKAQADSYTAAMKGLTA